MKKKKGTEYNTHSIINSIEYNRHSTQSNNNNTMCNKLYNNIKYNRHSSINKYNSIILLICTSTQYNININTMCNILSSKLLIYYNIYNNINEILNALYIKHRVINNTYYTIHNKYIIHIIQCVIKRVYSGYNININITISNNKLIINK
ncbi:hypothetical protein NEIG_02284 [Nematocida sp. ERTm5]|nr:hypothetical protein NEIG_02284 [Nematocida sp. ERTm5]